MKEQTVKSKSKAETQSLAFRLGEILSKPIVILLKGDLGAGKTTFTQGLAKGLGITKTVNSPTFNILKLYQGRMQLCHIDAYRLEGIHQDLGFEEYLIDGEGVCVVEWPMYISDLLPKEYLEIEILNETEDNRCIHIRAIGEDAQKILEEWL
ncbi:MAG: tRNA (adenosine(37)-N6)-threonylcarbamoyltransferase complex ATPase subunit type 1 TsaE [Erysipelotrichaceae bacterium]|nr:tRNA (adenosine(37)-N6)-threonylcarbamoyltransferase complex ATPase subunit type 1 TsaE [Erysipelotrichaceae bacterium]